MASRNRQQGRGSARGRAAPARPLPGGEAPSAREYLANERTFLAYVRTGVALVALGFVVARFGLLLRELGQQVGVSSPVLGGGHLSSFFGTGIVVLAALFLILSYARYVTTAQTLERGTYRSDRWLTTAVAVVVTVIALVLAVYLLLTL